MAPELLQDAVEGDKRPGQRKQQQFAVSNKQDVYSFSMVCYEAVTRQVPFYTMKREGSIENAVLQGERPTLDASAEVAFPGLLPLMRQCWAQDPDQRPDFTLVVERIESMLASAGGDPRRQDEGKISTVEGFMRARSVRLSHESAEVAGVADAAAEMDAHKNAFRIPSFFRSQPSNQELPYNATLEEVPLGRTQSVSTAAKDPETKLELREKELLTKEVTLLRRELELEQRLQTTSTVAPPTVLAERRRSQMIVIDDPKCPVNCREPHYPSDGPSSTTTRAQSVADAHARFGDHFGSTEKARIADAGQHRATRGASIFTETASTAHRGSSDADPQNQRRTTRGTSVFAEADSQRMRKRSSAQSLFHDVETSSQRRTTRGSSVEGERRNTRGGSVPTIADTVAACNR
jgi:hypothetical protein